MSRLQQLNNALILIIIRYHESQRGTVKLTANGKTEADILSELNHQSIEQSLESLQKLIDASTGDYQTRRALLNYTLKAIQYSSQFLKSETPLSQEVFQKTQSFLIDFVTNTKDILSKAKGTNTSISCDNINYELDGLTQGMWAAYGYCTSGAIISKTLFPALHLDVNQTHPEEIKSSISDICDEHQTKLELKQSKILVTELQEKLENLEQTNAKLLEENKTLNELQQAHLKVTHPANTAYKEIHARYTGTSSSTSSPLQYANNPGTLFGIAMLSKKSTPAKKTEQAPPSSESMEDPMSSAARLAYFPY